MTNLVGEFLKVGLENLDKVQMGDQGGKTGEVRLNVPEGITLSGLIMTLLDISWRGFADYEVKGISFTEDGRIGVYHEKT